MSSGRKNVSKTKIPEDEGVDSGFLSGPMDSSDKWSGDTELTEHTEHTERDNDDKCSDSGKCEEVIDSGIIMSGEIDSVGHISERLQEVKLVDLSTPSSPSASQPTSQEKRFIPPEQLSRLFNPDDDGDTQVHIAAIKGCIKSVGILINICPNKLLLEQANDQGQTPLHLAVMGGNDIVTRMLVQAGLSVGVRDRRGETPIHIATAAGNIQCINALLASTHRSEQRTTQVALNQRNYKGQACVHIAAAQGKLEVLQLLVNYGADINITENLAGRTALHIAARRGDVDMVRYIRERPKVDLYVEDFGGRTARRLSRKNATESLFEDDEDDYYSDSDDDMYDSDESLFERIREGFNNSPTSILA